MYDYVIVVDGGSLGNGTIDSKGYGSFQLTTRDGKTTIQRFEFGTNLTNNQSEYMALIKALQHVSAVIFTANKIHSDYSIQVKMDSALVIGQCHFGWRCKVPYLQYLRDQVMMLKSEFKLVDFYKISGVEMKRILGH